MSFQVGGVSQSPLNQSPQAPMPGWDTAGTRGGWSGASGAAGYPSPSSSFGAAASPATSVPTSAAGLGGFGEPVPPRRRRRFRFGWLGALLPILFVGFMVLGVPRLAMSQGSSTELLPVGAFTQVDGDDVVLMPYEADGVWLWDDTFQIRLAAVDVVAGEPIWDVQLNDDLIGAAGVLAAGAQYLYVVTDYGLEIRSVTDGRRVAGPDDIEGLGADYLAAYAAYGYDPNLNAIVMITSLGEYRTLPVDGLTATESDVPTINAWQSSVFADASGAWMYLDSGWDETTDAVVVGESRFDYGPLSPGVPGGTVRLTGPEGTVDLPGPVYNGEFLLEVTKTPPGLLSPEERAQGSTSGDAYYLSAAPAGAASGLVLLQSTITANGDDFRLDVLDATTGTVVGTTPMGDAVTRAMTAPGGTVVLVASGTDYYADSFVLVAPDGSVRVVEVGVPDLFGRRA
ncbi:PA2928 family protein [Occultella glacieicola]|uniref:PA2928 family protein n=1 Tax=Occultella glacieicola TaxID=2518684 RepID=UPI001404A025|nr:PA2928 family protein [Occultella glacieicola]